MGWSIKFVENGEVVRVDDPHNVKGSVYAISGTRYLETSMTYNYSAILRKALGHHFSELNGLQARTLRKTFRNAAMSLSNDMGASYWEATEGNVKQALIGLSQLAEMAPDNAIIEIR